MVVIIVLTVFIDLEQKVNLNHMEIYLRIMIIVI